ncbi:hypothetical protein OHA79_09420 [Streptomyces sp. NBC_00841]|uniref:hypothetical protein n=1 Tax=Streptomyces sp. NBC_00841 TaxID=2975847 RepID=UPI002DD9806E|nr:hypothetical protein [Streptomyces sp. NBC_00841]WRZ98034.1 hypothetical protein OHA79_09420 [Streptomyces sp. NBC_00841]
MDTNPFTRHTNAELIATWSRLCVMSLPGVYRVPLVVTQVETEAKRRGLTFTRPKHWEF